MKRIIFPILAALLAAITSAEAQTTSLQIQCPSNRTNWVCNPASTAVVTYPPPTATDSCTGTPTIVCTPPSGAVFILGTTVVTCRATNACRESARCTFNVTVAHDTIPPNIQCPANRTNVLCGTGSTLPVIYPPPVATDNADTNVTVNCTPPSGSSFPMGTTAVICTATDDCGNSRQCTFTITVVRDTVPPTIRCPGNTNVLACASTGRVVNYPSPVVSDNLDPSPTVTCVPASGSVFPPGTTTVTCTATDDCNNRTNCSFTVTVTVDSIPPVIRCPANTNIVLCGTASGVVNYPTPNVTDNLDASPKITCVPPSGGVFPNGTTTVTCTAADDCENLNTCSFTVTVVRDTTPPAITCPSNIVLRCLCTNQVIVLDFFQAQATDNLDPNPTIVCNPPSLVSSPGVHPVVCTATDDCGNSNRCQFTVTFLYDTAPPEIRCPTDVTVFTCDRSAVANYSVTATDNCDTNVTLVCTPPSGSAFPAGTTTVQCAATDRCGNRTTCTFPVMVRPLLFGGLCHSPLGLAALKVNTANELDVSGFGTTGQDGVRIELGDSQGLRWEMKFPTASTDGNLDVQALGRTTTGAEVLLNRMSYAFRNGRVAVTPGATSYEFKLLLNGTMVYRRSGRTGTFNLPPCIPIWNPHCFDDGPREFPDNPHLPYCMYLLGLSCDVETEDGPVRADALVVTPEDPLPPFQVVSAIQIRGSNLPGISLRSEALLLFGGREQAPIPHRALGQARLMPDNGSLAVADLGASGQDGVRLELDNARGLRWRMDSPPGAPEGDVAIAVFGRNSAGTEVLVRQITHRFQGGRRSVTPGAGNYEMRLLRRGQMVFQQHGRTGAVDIPPCLPVEHEECVGELFEDLAPDLLPYCFTILTIECDWDTSIGPVVADTLVLIPEGPPPPVAIISAVQIRGRNVQDLPVIRLRDERLLKFGGSGLRLTCPTDLRVQTCSTNRVAVSFLPPVVTGSNCTLPTVVTCVPPSGSLFSSGTTTVFCTATNACGQRAECRFNVTVAPDITPPVITCPSNIVVNTCSNHATVNFRVTAIDAFDPSVTVVCSPPSGSLFPMGTTTVICTATDNCTNHSRCSFEVTVRSAAVPVTEIEPNNTLATAHDLGAREFAVVVGRIAVAGDVDYYRFTAPTNTRAWITVDTGGPQWAGANSRDSVLTLYNAGGGMMETDDNDGSGNGANSTLESGNASAIAGVLLAGGTYHLSVSANAGGIIAPYRLYLTVTANTGATETEPNNTFMQANTIAIPAVPVGVRNATLLQSEEDWYAFRIAGPSLVHISVDADPERDGNGTDVVVELFRQNGVMMLFPANSSGAAGAAAEGFVYRLSLAGTYYVRVRTVAVPPIGGTYRIMVGHCPLPPPPTPGILFQGGRLTVSWPTAVESSVILSSRDLRSWKEMDITPMVDGDWLRAELPTTFPNHFFQLAPAGGWSNDTHHCCDANGQNCTDPVDILAACVGGIKIRCFETENSSECEPVGEPE